MVIETGLELDVTACRDTPESGHIDIHRSRPESENVHQVLASPGFHVESVHSASLQIAGNLGRQQKGAAACFLHLEQHESDPTDKLGHMITKLPLAARRENRNVPGEVQLKASNSYSCTSSLRMLSR